MKEINGRKADFPIDDIFLERHSPRALSGEPVSHDELMTLFEAARYAPSASNRQPWKFIYAMRGTPEFDLFFSFLVPFNQDWAIRAGTLIVTVSKKTKTDGSPNVTHSFDAGAAWENLALQGAQMQNMVVHGMGGIHLDLIKEKLAIPDDHHIEMMVAVGKKGKVEDLPEDLRARETPSDRKPLSEIVFEGKFPS